MQPALRSSMSTRIYTQRHSRSRGEIWYADVYYRIVAVAAADVVVVVVVVPRGPSLPNSAAAIFILSSVFLALAQLGRYRYTYTGYYLQRRGRALLLSCELLLYCSAECSLFLSLLCCCTHTDTHCSKYLLTLRVCVQERRFFFSKL